MCVDVTGCGRGCVPSWDPEAAKAVVHFRATENVTAGRCGRGWKSKRWLASSDERRQRRPAFPNTLHPTFGRSLQLRVFSWWCLVRRRRLGRICTERRRRFLPYKICPCKAEFQLSFSFLFWQQTGMLEDTLPLISGKPQIFRFYLHSDNQFQVVSVDIKT